MLGLGQVSMEMELEMGMETAMPTIQNVVAAACLNCKIDLVKLSKHARNVEYSPRRFSAAIMRIKEPRTTALIFENGKMVVTGAKTVDMSNLAARKMASILRKLGFEARLSEFRITNVVASHDVKWPISLEALEAKDQRSVKYEPELFPGLVYRMRSPKVVVLVFTSGKIILTGATRVEDIYQCFTNIYPLLWMCRKTWSSNTFELQEAPVVNARSQQPCSRSDQSALSELSTLTQLTATMQH